MFHPRTTNIIIGSFSGGPDRLALLQKRDKIPAAANASRSPHLKAWEAGWQLMTDYSRRETSQVPSEGIHGAGPHGRECVPQAPEKFALKP